MSTITRKNPRRNGTAPPPPAEPQPEPEPEPAEKPTTKGSLKVRDADLARARPFRWAWQQRILIQYLNLIVGEEGIGKGNLAAWIGARISRGQLPGDLRGTPRRVLFIGDEDSWDNIWVPRLHAAGADLSMVSTIEGSFDVAKQADELRDLIKEQGIGLVYFDQLLDNLGMTDTWKDKQVRDALAPLRRIAQEGDCAMVASLHPNKRQGSFRDRISGTPAFNALSRSSLLVARHPSVSGRVAVVRAKGNYDAVPPAFEFRIEEHVLLPPPGKDGEPLPKPITTSRITDTRESGLTREELLTSADRPVKEESQAAEIRSLLMGLFPIGSTAVRPAADVLAELKAEGFSERAVQEQRRALGIETWKAGYQGGYSWGRVKPKKLL